MASLSKHLRALLAVERALDDLRRQWGIIVQMEPGVQCAVFPVECLDGANWSGLRIIGKAKLLITGARAKHLGFVTDSDAVSIDAELLTLAELTAIAYEGTTSSVAPQTAPPRWGMVLRLAKYASLLPAVILVELDAKGRNHDLFSTWQTLSLDDAQNYCRHPVGDVVETARAPLPLAHREDATLIGFRTLFSSTTHLALVIGAKTGNAPLTRIHSSCVTGDLLGSLRCDCGDQLHLALEQLRQEGGILLYLYQEGRGIGISNKLRAYRLQGQGLDTYEANLALGFEEDERDFSIAAAILQKLGVERIRLLTNNPAKVDSLMQAGIDVVERVPLIALPGSHNQAYLKAKAKSGHFF